MGRLTRRVLNRFTLSFPYFLAVLFSVSATVSFAARDGASIFKSNCASCHFPPGKGKLIGPDLKDIEQKRSAEWLLKWIKNPSALIKSGDAAAVEVYNQFN